MELTNKTYIIQLISIVSPNQYLADFYYLHNGNLKRSVQKLIRDCTFKFKDILDQAYKSHFKLFIKGVNHSSYYEVTDASIVIEEMFLCTEDTGVSSIHYGRFLNPKLNHITKIELMQPAKSFYGLFICYGFIKNNVFNVFYKISTKKQLFHPLKKDGDYIICEEGKFLFDEDLMMNKEYQGYVFYDIFKNSYQVKKIVPIIECVVSVIKKPFHDEKNLYTVAQVDFIEYPEFEPILSIQPFIKGYFLNIFKGDLFKLKGFWQKEKEQYIFKVIQYQRDLSNNQKIMQEYLKLHMPKMVSQKLMNKFGLDALRKARESVSVFLDLGLKEKKAKELFEKITLGAFKDEIFEFFMMNNIDHKMALKIFKYYKTESLEKIKENPYQLIDDLHFSFKEIDEMAAYLNFDVYDEKRIDALVKFFIKQQVQNCGHLFVYKDDLLNQLNDFSKIYSFMETPFIKSKLIERSLLKMIEEKTLVIEKHVDSGESCIYLSYYYYIEKKIVNELLERQTTHLMPLCTEANVDEFINQYESKTGFKFAVNQKKAIHTVMKNNFTVLTGGPGTGKTQTLNGIIKCIQSVKPLTSIALLAPTGKASKRMKELTGIEAMTIHRKIKCIPFTDSFSDFLEPIMEDLVIIDESSMIDADLFFKLLEVIQPETRILLVGDINQIPSVGPGLILRDIIQSQTVEVVELNEIFRQSQDSQIVANAYKVINGKSDLTTSDKDFEMINLYNTVDIQQTILKTIEKECLGGERFSNIQVLTAFNKGDLGTFELNRLIQSRFNASNESLQVSPIKFFKLGDRVIQTRNDYDRRVYNGDTGIVTEINPDYLLVEIDGVFVEYTEENLDDLQLSYAMSIHKSQGSEFPIVIIPIHRNQEILLDKNLLYTAITRSRCKIYLIGEIEFIDNIVKKESALQRNSQILPKLLKGCR